MHTVCELASFAKSAVRAGMTVDEVTALISFLAVNPMAGDMMQGTGGCRKVRWAKTGKGKSGGYRTITFYSGLDMPVFLITVFAKGDRVNLSKHERNGLAVITKAVVGEYQK